MVVDKPIDKCLCWCECRSLELSTHVNMLGLVGNLAKSAPAHQFRPYVGLLLTHVLRVLNICVHVTSGKVPVVPSIRGSKAVDRKALSPVRTTPPSPGRAVPPTAPPPPPSAPTSALTGVLRLKSGSSSAPATPEHGGSKKLRGTSGASTGGGVAEGVAADDVDDGSGLSAPVGSLKGFFAHLPHYMKLYDTMKSAYDAGTITLEAESTGTSKFGDMIRAALEVMGVVVSARWLGRKCCGDRECVGAIVTRYIPG